MRFSSLLAVAIASTCSFAGTDGRDVLVQALKRQGISVPRQLLQRQPMSAHSVRSPGLAKRAGLGKALAGTGSISGTIHELDGVTPASYEYFSLVDTFGYEVVLYGSANQQGTFTVAGLYPGAYTVGTEYLLSRYYYGNTSDPRSAKWVRVADGEQVTGVDIVLPDPASLVAENSIGGATFSGSCFDEASTPLANVTLSIMLAQTDPVIGGDTYLSTTTDGQGAFSTSYPQFDS